MGCIVVRLMLSRSWSMNCCLKLKKGKELLIAKGICKVMSVLTMGSNKMGTVREENENQQYRSSWSQAASFPRIAVTSSSTLKKTGRLCLWQMIGTWVLNPGNPSWLSSVSVKKVKFLNFNELFLSITKFENTPNTPPVYLTGLPKWYSPLSSPRTRWSSETSEPFSLNYRLRGCNIKCF